GVEMGPVDYLVIEFAADRRTGEGLNHLVDLVDQGLIRILDLVFLRRNADETTTEIALADRDGELDLAIFRGASSGLVAGDDLAWIFHGYGRGGLRLTRPGFLIMGSVR